MEITQRSLRHVKNLNHEEILQKLINILKTFGRDFLLAWTVRGGVGLLPVLMRLIKSRKYFCTLEHFFIFRFQIGPAILAAFGRPATRFGLFIACYFALFKFLEDLIAKSRQKKDRWNSFIAGALASITLRIETEDLRWSFAQYLAVRAGQCVVEHLVARKPWLSRYVSAGDSLLFAICSGQLVYAFIVRPDTLDPDYSAFLTRIAQINPLIIKNVQNLMTMKAVDHEALINHVQKYGKHAPLGLFLRQTPAIIGCECIHPQSDCLKRIVEATIGCFKIVFPMYLSLHTIPAIVFKLKTFMNEPVAILKHSLINAVYSSRCRYILSGFFSIW